jgi:hypothetical protein
MSFRIVYAAIEAEQSDSLHEARLLLLLRHAAAKGDGAIDGITKLAKMDFLVRYPVYLERLLTSTLTRPPKIEMQAFERDTVESRMIRFRYGPWDPRYRRWIGILVAKGLAETYLEGKTVHVKLTEAGIRVAEQLASEESLADLDRRAKQVSRSVGGRSGTWLKDKMYEVVPQLSSMAWGEEITV